MSGVCKPYVALCAAVAMFGGVEAALAATFEVRQQNSSNVFKDASGQNAWYANSTVKLGDVEKSVAAGLFRLTAVGREGAGSTENFVAFCIDLNDWLSLPAQYSDYPTNFTPAALTRIDRLLSNVSATNATTAAATQLALWEIVTDGQGDGPLDLNDGGFRVVSSAAKSQANDYVAKLNDSAAWTTRRGGWVFIDTPDFLRNGKSYGQELVALDLPPSPVPLPASVWLLGLGVAGLGAIRRKRGAA